MFPISPRTTLLLLLGLSAVVLGGGLRLARQEEQVRQDRDREALRRLYGDLQTEMQRLEAAYENHLNRVAHARQPVDAFSVRQAAGRIEGIRQFSLLHDGPKAGSDVHIPIASNPNERIPVPMFELPQSGIAGTPLLISRDPILSDPVQWDGWIDEPGKPLLFWQRLSSTEAVVLMIDRAEVQAAINRWLVAWAPDYFGPVRAAGGPDELRTREGRSLVMAGDHGSLPPDLLLPLRSHLGAWDLASWDRRVTRAHYDSATVAVGTFVSGFIALLGILLFIQQHRAAALAAQRVSFVNRVSHELRTPLTNILLNVDLAADALSEESPETTRRLGLVQEEARRLGRLIDNVLTFSRREQGKLRLQPHACVPASAVEVVVQQFAPAFVRRALEVRCTGDLSARCLLDADAFAQILGNLLSNVEKYVPGGLVEIDGSITAGELRLTVADRGPGIPPEAAERIFRPFERLDSRVNEGVSGTGLGLAIARDLAASQGGSLRLLPSERGACFELRLPAPAAPDIAAIDPAA